MVKFKPLNDFDYEVKTEWVFHEQYEDLGPCMCDGIVIIQLLKADESFLEKCPGATAWLKKLQDTPF